MPHRQRVALGLESLAEDTASLAGQRLGLVVSPASVDADLNSTIERLRAIPALRLTALFGPEHGVRGDAQAGELVENTVDHVTGLPMFSLYGATKQPTADMLADVDTLVFDLQDVGLRFYTYLSTLVYVMQAAAQYGKRVVVLDRPNPLNGVSLAGGLVDASFTSFVGLVPVAMRYGLTAGEIAQYLKAELSIHCDLHIIPMRGWQRSMWHDDTGLPFVPPSPNIPTLDSLVAYAGTCLIEGTNLSEGRGTTRPFEIIGAPYIDAHTLAQQLNSRDLPGVRFRPVYFTPTFSKYQGETCGGVQLYVNDRAQFDPVRTTLLLIADVKQRYPDQFAWRDPWAAGSHRPIDLLSGSMQLRQHLDADGEIDALLSHWQNERADFELRRTLYYLYTA